MLRRPFSIHQVDGDRVGLLFSVRGKGTEWLRRRAPGDCLDVLGPLGNGFRIECSSRNVLLVAGGIGIAPLSFLADRAVAQGHTVRLVTGARTAAGICPGLTPRELHVITEDGSAGEKGLATDAMLRFADWADEVFACGPILMYRTMLAARGVVESKPVQILLEQVMGCGVGACRGCVVPTVNGMKSVCHDGPVFDLREVIWEEVPVPGAGGLRAPAPR